MQYYYNGQDMAYQFPDEETFFTPQLPSDLMQSTSAAVVEHLLGDIEATATDRVDTSSAGTAAGGGSIAVATPAVQDVAAERAVAMGLWVEGRQLFWDVGAAAVTVANDEAIAASDASTAAADGDSGSAGAGEDEGEPCAPRLLSLTAMSRGECLESPSFWIAGTELRLAFFPQGDAFAGDGDSSAALLCDDKAKLKFEFILNGRSFGRKVLLGKKFSCDFRQPASLASGACPSAGEVVVGVQVHENLLYAGFF